MKANLAQYIGQPLTAGAQAKAYADYSSRPTWMSPPTAHLLAGLR